jgi:transcriptional regulator with XRE-family HTH domain
VNDSRRLPRSPRRATRSSASDDATIGRRIAHHRRRRGLSQRELAQRLGRSVAWVSGVERGRYHLDRLPLLTTLAAILKVEVTDLVPEGSDWMPETTEGVEDATGLVATLSAYRVLGFGFGVEPLAVDLDDLEARIDQLDPLVEGADHEAAARALVEIVPLAEAAGIRHWTPVPSAPAEASRAFHLLSRAYRQASQVLYRLGHFAAAWLATDRSISAAGRAGDRAAVVAAVLRVARLFLDDGRHGQARSAAESVVSGLAAIVETADGQPVHWALAGSAHLLLAEIAAIEWNRGTAEHHLADAAALAERLPDGWRGYDIDFGDEAVGLGRVVVAVELQDAGVAADRAQRLDSDLMSPQRRARLLLHWARAEIQRKAPDRALKLMTRADRLDPDQTAHFPPAWRTVEELGALAERIHDRGDLAGLQARVRRR